MRTRHHSPRTKSTKGHETTSLFLFRQERLLGTYRTETIVMNPLELSSIIRSISSFWISGNGSKMATEARREQNWLCFPEFTHTIKKNSTCGGLWRPLGFPFKKKIFSHRSRKPPKPRPTSWRRRCRNPVRTRPEPTTALWHMGTGEGIFLTSAWNPLPRRVEPRTWGVPLGHLTVWARRPLAACTFFPHKTW